MNEKRPLTSLKVFLDRIKSDHTRKSIATKLKRVMDLNTEIDSDPIDAFRLLGKVTIRIQLIEELNKFISEHAAVTYSVSWTRELWELREHCRKLVASSTEMCRALIFQGHPDGLYTPEQTSTEKEALS